MNHNMKNGINGVQPVKQAKKIKDNIEIRELFKVLKVSDSKLSLQKAINSLSRIDKEIVIPFLVKEFPKNRNSIEFRLRLLECLWTIGDDEAISIIISALGDRSEEIRDKADEILTEIGKPIVDQLITELHQADNLVSCGIVDVLGEIGDDKATQPLFEILDDSKENNRIRYNAIEALGGIGGKKPLDRLIAIFLNENEDECIRKVARRTAYTLKLQAIDHAKELKIGKVWNPSTRNILSLLKQRRALAIKFNK